jgi:starch phosphorylase
VQLYAGAINATGHIEKPSVIPMSLVRPMAPNRYVFSGQIVCTTSGRQGFAARVVPGEADMSTPFEPGLIVWN